MKKTSRQKITEGKTKPTQRQQQKKNVKELSVKCKLLEMLHQVNIKYTLLHTWIIQRGISKTFFSKNSFKMFDEFFVASANKQSSHPSKNTSSTTATSSPTSTSSSTLMSTNAKNVRQRACDASPCNEVKSPRSSGATSWQDTGHHLDRLTANHPLLSASLNLPYLPLSSSLQIKL